MANYTFSKTASGQGNWNTGGSVTGHGSLSNGIQGVSPRYNVAPSTGSSSGVNWKPPRPRYAGQPRSVPVRPRFPGSPQAPPPSYGTGGYGSALQDYLNQVGTTTGQTPFGYKDYPSRTAPSPIGQGSTHYPTSNYPPAGQMTISPSGNYGNDMYGTSFGSANDRNRAMQRGRSGMGYGGGGGGGY